MKEKKGKYLFGVVKVGEKGQIVIPSDARKIFDIHPGDRLLFLGDVKQGMAMIKEESLTGLARHILNIDADGAEEKETDEEESGE